VPGGRTCAPGCRSRPEAKDQATSNVHSLVWAMLAENDSKAARELGNDLAERASLLYAAAGRQAGSRNERLGRPRGAARHLRPARPTHLRIYATDANSGPLQATSAGPVFGDDP
jgi:hypothetical protein